MTSISMLLLSKNVFIFFDIFVDYYETLQLNTLGKGDYLYRLVDGR